MVIAHGHSIRCFIGMSLLPEDTRHCLQHFRVVVKEKQRLYEERSVVVVLLSAFQFSLEPHHTQHWHCFTLSLKVKL